ncbi:MAG: pantoate--beta-alanine ligase [Ferruginibacter sp.]
MIVFKHISDLKKHLKSIQEKGISIAFVPTMGALHQGHISLINAANKENNLLVSSIFVNPTQFNDPSDFEKYPKTLENDIRLLEQANCAILFLPETEEIYPSGLENHFNYALGYIETILEGQYRSGHFQGVCQVVHRLLNIVEPDTLYLGQKDYQQCMIIQKMIELTQLNIKVAIGATLRESDGLAMSSRNMRLTEADRKTAPKIFETLNWMMAQKHHLQPKEICTNATNQLIDAGFVPDYAAICDAATLKPIDRFSDNIKPVYLIAASLNNIRLIDNIVEPN